MRTTTISKSQARIAARFVRPFLGGVALVLAVTAVNPPESARAQPIPFDLGKVVAWGDDFDGQTDVPARQVVVAVSAGQLHSLALRAPGPCSASNGTTTESAGQPFENGIPLERIRGRIGFPAPPQTRRVCYHADCTLHDRRRKRHVTNCIRAHRLTLPIGT